MLNLDYLITCLYEHLLYKKPYTNHAVHDNNPEIQNYLGKI